MTVEFDSTLTLSVQVTDWERAKSWYQDVLGLSLQYEVAEIGWCEFQWGVPGTTIGLDRVEKVNTSDAVIPTLGVRDIEAARADLESKGVEFLNDIFEVEGMVKLTKFVDPDGNHLCFAESLVQS